MLRGAVDVTEEFKAEVRLRLYQGSPFSSFFFSVVMDRPRDQVKQEFQWTMMFADDVLMCGKSVSARMKGKVSKKYDKSSDIVGLETVALRKTQENRK